MTRDSRNIWDELTKPQRALLTAIGDGRAVQAHPKPFDLFGEPASTPS